MPAPSLAYSTDEALWVAGARNIVKGWLQACNIAYPSADVGRNDELYRICYEAAVREGYPVEKSSGLGHYLSVGVDMIATAYAHLPDMSTRIWISNYTVFLAAADDLFGDNLLPVQVFFRRMLAGERQAHPALDALASILNKTAEHFDPVQDALILTSSLNFVTAQSVEDAVSAIELPPCAQAYAKWSSVLSGANEAYAMFIFPRGVPFQEYAHAIPDMMTFIRNTNDILSFYKEEIVGENGNHVSLIAQGRQISKLDALQSVAEETAAAYHRVKEILQANPIALAAWMSFAAGYVGFHVASKRYRLAEFRVDA